MYIQQVKGGFRFFESYIDPLTRIRKRTSITLDRNTTKTRKEAADLLARKIQTLTDPQRLKTTQALSVKAVCDAWVKYQAENYKEQTAIINQSEANVLLTIIDGKIAVDQLTARYINTVISQSGRAASWKNARVHSVKKIINWAYKMDYVPDKSWLDKLVMYKDDAAARRQYKYMEEDELKKVLAVMSDRDRLITQVLALSGMRIGELISLKTANVDLDKRVIHIVETYSPAAKKDTTAKTDSSNRDIYIQDELLAVLKHVFPGPVYYFGHVRYKQYNDALKAATKQTIGRELSTHAMRHTHIALLAAAQVPLDVASRRVGHKNIDITRNIYFHVTEKLKKSDENYLDRARLINATA